MEERKPPLPASAGQAGNSPTAELQAVLGAVMLGGAGKGSATAAAAEFSRRSRAELALRKTERKLQLLLSTRRAQIHATDETALLKSVCRILVLAGGYRLAWADKPGREAGRELRPLCHFSEIAPLAHATPDWSGIEFLLAPGHAAMQAGTIKLALNLPAQAQAGAAWAHERGLEACVALPLTHGDQMLGVLVVCAPEAAMFEHDEVQLLKEIADDLAYGLTTLRRLAECEVVERKHAFLARHDPLTLLPNRLMLRRQFGEISAVADYAHCELALVLFDLDDFKQVNDNFGHTCGDQLLLLVAKRLQACVDGADIVSRQGGGEFTLLLRGGGRIDAFNETVQRVLLAFAEPFEIEGYILNMSICMGISRYPDDAADFDNLIKHAGTAIAQAKESGSAYCFYTEKMRSAAVRRMQMHSHLRQAISAGEFSLHYQPQIALASGSLVGAEALLRWHRPGVGTVMPGEFIPLAEQTGLIVPIGDWVLHEACRQAQAWREAGMPPMTVAVNLSGLQFKNGNIVATVAEALRQARLPAACLELELTESILLQDSEVTVKTLQSLKALGVTLSIDDFGTGYYSLSYLKSFAVDKLKIDRSFIRELGVGVENTAIVRAIIELGHTLKLSVVAEGVETDLQLAILQNYGCNDAQGYLFSAPVSSAGFAAFCRLRHA